MSRDLIDVSEQVQNYRLYEHRGGPPGWMFEIVVEVTYRCNLHCKHCHVNAAAKDIDMPFEDAKSLFEQAAKLGVQRVYITGGEPTVRKDLLDILNCVNNAGLEIGLITNGTLLNKEMVRALRKLGAKVVAISLTRSDPRAFDEFTGLRGSFNKAIDSIKMCVDEQIPRVVMLTLGCEVGMENEIDRLIELAASLGAEIGDERIMPIGRAKQSQLLANVRNHEEYMRHLHKKRHEYKSRVEISSVDPLWHLVDPNGQFSYLSEGSTPDRQTPRCTAGWHMCVTPDLKVKPCAFSRVLAGDLRKNSLDYIWHESTVMKAIRHKDNLKGKCGRCELRYKCGGCRSSAFAYYGDYFAEDPLCWLDV